MTTLIVPDDSQQPETDSEFRMSVRAELAFIKEQLWHIKLTLDLLLKMAAADEKHHEAENGG